MKRTRNTLCKLALFSSISFFCTNPSFGQEKVNISAGIGFPELLNVGVRYQLRQAQLGISVGSFPSKEGSILSVSGDSYGHFAGVSKLSNRRPWYGRMGLDYLRGEDSITVQQSLYLNLRIGRDFNISKKLGIQIDTGLIFQLYDEVLLKVPVSGWSYEPFFETSVLPSLGIGFFYRL